jgi:MFS family permease
VATVPDVLRVPAFRRFWLASLASNAGSWLQIVAAGYLIYHLTGSPAAVGALALVARGPAFVLSTYGGQLADRHDRRAVGMATFGLQAVGAGVLAALTWADLLSPAAIYVCSFLVGVGFALGLPSMLALVGELATRERLPEAVALNAAGINLARLAGPALGGLVLAILGAGACFALNAISFLAVIWVLAGLPRFLPHDARAGVGMRGALSYARRDPAIRRLLIGMVVFATLAAPVQELAPVVAARLDAGKVGLGLLLGAMGGGALAGAWGLEGLSRNGYPRHHALPTATTAFAVGVAVVAASPWFGLTLAAMAFCGFFWIWMFIATNTAIQLRSPREMLGRMLGLYQLSVVGPIAVGALAAGGLAQAVGIGWSLGACALGLGAYGVWSLTHRVSEIDGIGRESAPDLAGGVLEGVSARARRARAG